MKDKKQIKNMYSPAPFGCGRISRFLGKDNGGKGMKRQLLSILSAAVFFSATIAIPVSASAESTSISGASNTAADWTLTRAAVEYTDEGIAVRQTEKGTPDNHAIAIYEIPFDNLDTFEITFRITMEDYVASGRNANDVWTAVNIMGVPAFFNWRNSEEYGWAKDTPGLVTRFMSYDGDLRFVTDVYQEDYRTAGDDSSSQVVDTWTLLNASAGASLTSDVTMKFAWETNGDSQFYSMYLNGRKVSSSDELAFVDREVLFPESKLYLTVVMNTQDKESNALSEVLIKKINDVNYVKESENAGTSGGAGSENGCGSLLFSGSVLAGFAVVASVYVFGRKKR